MLKNEKMNGNNMDEKGRKRWKKDKKSERSCLIQDFSHPGIK